MSARRDTVGGERYIQQDGSVLLDWSGQGKVLRHSRDCKFPCQTWQADSDRRRPPDPCRYCGKTAHLRDDDGRPAHKVCVERAINEEIRGRRP